METVTEMVQLQLFVNQIFINRSVTQTLRETSDPRCHTIEMYRHYSIHTFVNVLIHSCVHIRVNTR